MSHNQQQNIVWLVEKLCLETSNFYLLVYAVRYATDTDNYIQVTAFVQW
jgi:hypothetical protein